MPVTPKIEPMMIAPKLDVSTRSTTIIDQVRGIRDGKNHLADTLRTWILAGGPVWTPYPRTASDDRGPSAWFQDWERHNGLLLSSDDFPNVLAHPLWGGATWSTGQALEAATPRAALPIPVLTAAVSPPPFVNDVSGEGDAQPTDLVPSTVTVTAVDSSDGIPLVGTVLANGRPVGRIGVPFTYTFIDREVAAARPEHRLTTLAVAAIGYPSQRVSYGVEAPEGPGTPVVTSVEPASGHPEYQRWTLNSRRLWILTTFPATVVSIRGQGLFVPGEVPQISFGALQAEAQTTTNGLRQLIQASVPPFEPRPGGGRETVALIINSSRGTIAAGDFTVQVPEPLGQQPGET
jgi:hypothetical protein